MKFQYNLCKKPISKIPKVVFKTNCRLMQVTSNAECTKGRNLENFRLSLSYRLSLRSLFCPFSSACFTLVILFSEVEKTVCTPQTDHYKCYPIKYTFLVREKNVSARHFFYKPKHVPINKYSNGLQIGHLISILCVQNIFEGANMSH